MLRGGHRKLSHMCIYADALAFLKAIAGLDMFSSNYGTRNLNSGTSGKRWKIL